MIAAVGGEAIAHRADVADEAAVAALFDAAEETFGGVDVVVHAAGVMTLAPLVDMDLDALDRMYRTNIRGTFVVDQQAARRLRGGGAIINFSSSVLSLALPGYTAYAATKGAVEAMTLILARELRGKDITVNAVAPGPTATALFLDGKDEATIEKLMRPGAAGAPRDSAGHRGGRRLPRRSRPLGQRPGRACQRRHRLTPPAAAADRRSQDRCHLLLLFFLSFTDRKTED